MSHAGQRKTGKCSWQGLQNIHQRKGRLFTQRSEKRAGRKKAEKRGTMPGVIEKVIREWAVNLQGGHVPKRHMRHPYRGGSVNRRSDLGLMNS